MHCHDLFLLRNPILPLTFLSSWTRVAVYQLLGHPPRPTENMQERKMIGEPKALAETWLNPFSEIEAKAVTCPRKTRHIGWGEPSL